MLLGHGRIPTIVSYDCAAIGSVLLVRVVLCDAATFVTT